MNPCTDDVFTGNLSNESTLRPLYQREADRFAQALHELQNRSGALESRTGSAALLVSPKAGAGKTHFLARLAFDHKLAGQFCSLPMHDPDELSWEWWFRKFVERLHSTKAPQGEHTALTGAAAFLFANATGALVSEGRIPCNSPATASQWLLENSVRIFDYAERENASVVWFRNEFPRLLPEIVDRYVRDLDLDRGILMSRLEWLFDYAMLSASDKSFADRRAAQRDFLAEAEMLAIQGEGAARREWEWLGRMVSLQRPVVLTIDELDWAYRDEATALRLARMLSEFSRLVPRSLAVISVNEDTWQETFDKGLPEAVVDRLTSSVYRLEGVPRDLWVKFLATRSTDQEDQVCLEKVSKRLLDEHNETNALMPRRLLRQAARLWEEVEAGSETKDEPRVYAKPKLQLEPKEEVPTSKGDTRQPWSHALGGLQSLIRARKSAPTPSASDRPATPFIDVSGRDVASLKPKPMSKPELTPEFRSFLSGLRARATDKDAYLPQVQPATAEERARERSQLILHGRSERREDVKTERVEVMAEALKEKKLFNGDYKTRLRELKLRFAETGGEREIQAHRLRRLIRQAGTLFPAISQEVMGAPEDPQGELRWAFQQSEVTFGFQSFEAHRYWRELVQSSAERARRLRVDNRTRAKLAVFGRTREDDRFPSWDVDESESVDLQFCDLILLTDHQLLVVYAIDELLAEEVPEESREAVFAQVSGEIDFFWKMITRPVWNLVSPMKGSALSD